MNKYVNQLDVSYDKVEIKLMTSEEESANNSDENIAVFPDSLDENIAVFSDNSDENNLEDKKSSDTPLIGKFREHYFDKLETIKALTEGNFLLTLGDQDAGKTVIQNAILSRLKKFDSFEHSPTEIEVTEDDIKNDEQSKIDKIIDIDEKNRFIALKKKQKEEREKDLDDEEKEKVKKERLDELIRKKKIQLYTNQLAILNQLTDDMDDLYLPDRTQVGKVEKFEISVDCRNINIVDISGEDMKDTAPKHNVEMKLADNLDAYIKNRKIRKTFILVADSDTETQKYNMDKRLKYLLDKQIMHYAGKHKIKIMLIVTKWDKGNKNGEITLADYLKKYLSNTVKYLVNNQQIDAEYISFQVNGIYQEGERFRYKDMDQKALRKIIGWIYDNNKPRNIFTYLICKLKGNNAK